MTSRTVGTYKGFVDCALSRGTLLSTLFHILSSLKKAVAKNLSRNLNIALLFPYLGTSVLRTCENKFGVSFLQTGSGKNPLNKRGNKQ